MKDITQLQTDMRMLSVRIMDSENKHCGSGLLYIHDEKNVFVLTAAHVLGEFGEGQKFFVKCHPDPSPGNDESEEEDKYIFSISRTEDNVQPAYIPGAFPKHKYNVQDAAVIRLDISGKEDWILKRKRAKFAPENKNLERAKVAGSGYPEIKGSNPSTHMASKEIEPTKAICEKHNLDTAHGDSKHEVEWSLGIEVSDPNSTGETGGWSGCILALVEANEITLAGIALAIYPQYEFKLFRGADMYFIRKLLEGKWVEKVNEADPNPNGGNLTEMPQIHHQELVVNVPAMPPVSDFNLRCVRNMLEGAPEGQSWAHKLRDQKNCTDVEFSYENELGNRMLIDTFPDDLTFLRKILPNDILKVLFGSEENQVPIDQIMDGRYSDEIRNNMFEELVRTNCKLIDEIINKCSKLMKCPGWERSFCVARKAFFALMGKEVYRFRADVQACMIFNSKKNDVTARVLAMFIVYTLLGAERYGVMPIIVKKPIEQIFR